LWCSQAGASTVCRCGVISIQHTGCETWLELSHHSGDMHML
jgi:hypothetical protein